MKFISISLALMIFLVGCKPMREYKEPEISPNLGKVVLTQDSAKYQKSEPIAAWWREFNDPQLSSLIETSLQTNSDVRIALAHLFEARAITDSTEFDRIPTIKADAAYTAGRISKRESGNKSNNSSNNYKAGFDALWELDLFGRVSERIAEKKALEEASLAELQQIYVTVAAEVAANYMELRGSQYLLNIAKLNTQNKVATYNLAKKLEKEGKISAIETLRAQINLDNTKASIPPIKAKINSMISRLSVLTGQMPDALKEKLRDVKPLPSLPMSVNVGSVEELLKRRPDIKAAERKLAASFSQYNVIAAEIFPTVNIVGSIGFLSTDLTNPKTTSATTSIGPSLSWRFLDLGRVRAQMNQADARSKAALAEYEKTILKALEEAQTSLNKFSYEEVRRASLRNAANSAKHSSLLSRNRFSQGIDSFLNVLDAKKAQIEAEQSLAKSEIESALNLIAVYKSLGGGWQVMTEEGPNNKEGKLSDDNISKT